MMIAHAHGQNCNDGVDDNGDDALMMKIVIMVTMHLHDNASG